jgi:hypothetical protein
MDYFLMAREGWTLSAQQFVEILKSRWPLVHVRPAEIPGGVRVIEFQFEMADSTMNGALHRGGATVILNGALRDCIEFVLWYRSRLPPEARPMLFFDEGYNRDIEIQDGTTLEDVLRAFTNKPAH